MLSNLWKQENKKERKIAIELGPSNATGDCRNPVSGNYINDKRKRKSRKARQIESRDLIITVFGKRKPRRVPVSGRPKLPLALPLKHRHCAGLFSWAVAMSGVVRSAMGNRSLRLVHLAKPFQRLRLLVKKFSRQVSIINESNWFWFERKMPLYK